MKAIEKKYYDDVEIFFPDSIGAEQLSLNFTDSSERMKFSSVEELESFSDVLKSEQKNGDVSTLGSSPLYTGHVKWYAALLGGTFSWKIIDYKYGFSAVRYSDMCPFPPPIASFNPKKAHFNRNIRNGQMDAYRIEVSNH